MLHGCNHAACISLHNSIRHVQGELDKAWARHRLEVPHRHQHRQRHCLGLHHLWPDQLTMVPRYRHATIFAPTRASGTCWYFCARTDLPRLSGTAVSRPRLLGAAEVACSHWIAVLCSAGGTPFPILPQLEPSLSPATSHQFHPSSNTHLPPQPVAASLSGLLFR